MGLYSPIYEFNIPTGREFTVFPFMNLKPTGNVVFKGSVDELKLLVCRLANCLILCVCGYPGAPSRI